MSQQIFKRFCNAKKPSLTTLQRKVQSTSAIIPVTAITSKQFITPKNSELSTTFIVKGYVDYTNKYGSLKRYDYECHVTRAEGEHWETDYLNVYYEGFSK
ncbi:hypothetical protein AAEJ42_05675 [Shewanella algae]|uniref:hypothetical protein n=1 Tax=Shewanella algae TaxID=38313 RepID=UPI0011C07982|nr:hypothetical protein [Shewanella algae]MBO2607393.1 hypothetical protein [Shewanella algae]